jgi:hypothetical protein
MDYVSACVHKFIELELFPDAPREVDEAEASSHALQGSDISSAVETELNMRT